MWKQSKQKKMERDNIMKKLSKAILMAALGIALVPTAKASTGYDLILGVTQQGANSSGQDYLLDLGSYFNYGSGSIAPSDSWNLDAALTAQGFNLNTIQWGVIGDANSADTGSAQEITYVTTPGLAPGSLNGDAAFQQVQTPINAILTDFGVDGQTTFTDPGQSTTVAASGANSWNTETIAGTLGTDFHNASVNPNVTGASSDTLWQVLDDNSAPTDLGSFSFNSTTGVLTFTAAPVPEPGTLGLVGIGGLLVAAWRSRLSRKA
jgi:hypothetical protein